LGWLLAGAGVASTGIALGVGFTLAANDKFSQGMAVRNALVANTGPTSCAPSFPQNAAVCANLSSVLQNHDTFTDVAVWSFIVGGAVAAGTLTYAFWPVGSGSQTAASTQVVPLVTPFGGSILVDTHF
jgi:hypothetical protein